MIHLKFRNSNTLAYSIVEIDIKKYLLDLASIRGRRFLIGLLPKEIIFDMIELDPFNHSFEIKSRTSLTSTTIAVMVQPLVAILYRILKSIFISAGLNQQIFMKIALFVFSMVLAYLGAIFYEKSARRKVALLIPNNCKPNNCKRFKLVFKPNGKRLPVLIIGIVLNLICLILFLLDTSGSEVALIVVNGLISLFFFFIARMPTISSVYKNRELLIVKMEEIEPIVAYK